MQSAMFSEEAQGISNLGVEFSLCHLDSFHPWYFQSQDTANLVTIQLEVEEYAAILVTVKATRQW